MILLQHVCKVADARHPVSPNVRGLSCISGAQLGGRGSHDGSEVGRAVGGPRSVACSASATSSRHESHDRWGSSAPSKPVPIYEGVADDASLANPLARMNRLGTGWFGVVFEFEGVLVESAHDEHERAWLEICKREGKSSPPLWALQRADGMKNEQVISEVLCLARNPEVVRRLAAEKEEIFLSLRSARKAMPLPGVLQLLATLRNHDIPIAVASTAPEKRLRETLQTAGILPYLTAVVSAEDVSRGRPDPEPYLYAAQAIGRPPLRCVVMGSSNLSVEGAHDVGMKCVAVANRNKVYELTAADLVVRHMDQLSVQNMKQLFGMEEGRPVQLPELEVETETETAVGQHVVDPDDPRHLN